MQSGSAPSGEKGTRQAPHAWRRLFTARWWLVPAATRPGEAGVVPAHVPLTRISSLGPNLRARAEICPRLPSQATSTTSDGEAATPPKNRMVPPPASVDEHCGSAGPARQVHFDGPGIAFSCRRSVEACSRPPILDEHRCLVHAGRLQPRAAGHD